MTILGLLKDRASLAACGGAGRQLMNVTAVVLA